MVVRRLMTCFLTPCLTKEIPAQLKSKLSWQSRCGWQLTIEIMRQTEKDNNNHNDFGDNEWVALNLDPPFVRQETEILKQLEVLKSRWHSKFGWRLTIGMMLQTEMTPITDDEWHWPSLNLDPAFVRQETEIPTPSGHYHRFACVVLRLKGPK